MSGHHLKNLVLQWNQSALDAIQYTKTSPPLAARALAMLHTAMYDAWSVYDPCAVSTTTALYIPQPGCKGIEYEQKAYSYAAYRVLTDLFCLQLPAEHKNIFRDIMCSNQYDPDDRTMDISVPQGIGNLVARLTIENRHGDGANQLGTLHSPPWSDYTGYVPVNTPDQVCDLNYWQPLKVEVTPGEYKVQSFIVPHWGLVRPFALNPNWQFRPGQPYRKHEVQFKEQAKEVLDISACLTGEQKIIAEYWADGAGTFTPPGHWCEIGHFISIKRNYSGKECIKLFFALANALLDSSITCWECKRQFDAVRPVTVIRELYKGKDVQAWGGPHQGTRTIKGEKWMAYIPTPSFPEYVSGHSTFSASAATILNCFTGSDQYGDCIIVKKGESYIEPRTTPANDLTLRWNTFTEAVQQAGMSRLYGGIHFMRANEYGQELGKCVGQKTWEKALGLFNG